MNSSTSGASERGGCGEAATASAGTDCAGRRCAADRYGSSPWRAPDRDRGSREPRVRATASDALAFKQARSRFGRRAGAPVWLHTGARVPRWPTVSMAATAHKLGPYWAPGAVGSGSESDAKTPVPAKSVFQAGLSVSGRLDLNQRPSGPQPDALPDCATPETGPDVTGRIGCGPLCVRQCSGRQPPRALPLVQRLLGRGSFRVPLSEDGTC